MAERDDLLASIAATTADYREGDLAAPTPEHVERWINQFDAAVQLPQSGRWRMSAAIGFERTYRWRV